jgi:hypothetical protein
MLIFTARRFNELVELIFIPFQWEKMYSYFLRNRMKTTPSSKL